ncbi:MAG TPA: amidohydrolase family protein [Burkholderiales bacterium]|nr:amidohydrolase family protein [Burkholderiales bacterium]
MGRFLSDRELARTIGAETRQLRSPLPTAIVSNGEYNPVPQSPQQKQVEAEIATLGERYGRRLGLTRRRFLASSAGMAAAFVAMNKVYGPLFAVSEAEAAEPEAADARAGALRDQFVFDVQLHFIRDDFNWQPLAQIMSFAGEHWYPAWKKKGLDLKRFKFENFLTEVFLDSDTKVGLISSAPFDEPSLVILTNDEMAEARALINSVAGSRRALCHAVFTPGKPGWMDEVDRAIAMLEPDSWKGYTIGDPFGMSKFPWRLDDEKVAYPFYEKIAKAGISTVCIHKGLMPTELLEKAPQLAAFGKVDDVTKAAKDWPDIDFVIYHSGYRMAIELPDALLAEFHKTGYIEWTSDLVEAVEKNGLRNVYAELGTSFANCCVTHPRLAAGFVGQLVKGMGADRVLWGTDCVWWGSPQWQIEALRRLEVPEDLQKRFGYPALGPADGAVKSKIFGLNAAKLYGLDPAGLQKSVKADQLERMRERHRAKGRMRSNLAYGYIAR